MQQEALGTRPAARSGATRVTTGYRSAGSRVAARSCRRGVPDRASNMFACKRCRRAVDVQHPAGEVGTSPECRTAEPNATGTHVTGTLVARSVRCLAPLWAFMSQALNGFMRIVVEGAESHLYKLA